MRRKRRRQAGMSLLEVLAAITLFAIVAAGTGALAAQSMLRTAQNRHASAGTMLVQQELERVRGVLYANITNASQTKVMGAQSYTVTTGVLDNTPAANMKQVTVRVDWTGPEGAKSYQVQTIYTDVSAF